MVSSSAYQCAGALAPDGVNAYKPPQVRVAPIKSVSNERDGTPSAFAYKPNEILSTLFFYYCYFYYKFLVL